MKNVSATISGQDGTSRPTLATLLDRRKQGKNRFRTPKSTGRIADKRC